MKKTIAKLFCFLTVLLLSSNVVIGFGHYQSQHAGSNLNKDSRHLIEFQFKQLNSTDSQISFIAENDSFEDFELLADLPLSYSFEFKSFTFCTLSKFEFGSYNYSGFKVPRWLWIRHIII